jgi:hypothetical protein
VLLSAIIGGGDHVCDAISNGDTQTADPFHHKRSLQYPIGPENGDQNQSSPTGDRKNGAGGDRGGRAAGRRPRAELMMGGGMGQQLGP